MIPIVYFSILQRLQIVRFKVTHRGKSSSSPLNMYQGATDVNLLGFAIAFHTVFRT